MYSVNMFTFIKLPSVWHINTSSSRVYLLQFRCPIATMQQPTVTGYLASFCVQDPNWKHLSAGPLLTHHQPVFVHQSESASLVFSKPLRKWCVWVWEIILGAWLLSRQIQTRPLRPGVMNVSLPLSPWLCDKPHQLLLLDLKMPLKGVMDFRDQSELQ